jgi:hypothetical protein
LSLSYCGKYKDAGLRMNKRMGGGIKKCGRCHNDNFDGGKFCKLCRVIVLAEFKEKNRLRRMAQEKPREATGSKATAL